MTTYLKATDEASLFTALQDALIANIQWLGRGAPVTDPTLIATLDMQPVDADLSCEYEGNHYAARDGTWLILLPVAVARQGVFLDIIGTISKRIGGTDEEQIMETLDVYHANIYSAV